MLGCFFFYLILIALSQESKAGEAEKKALWDRKQTGTRIKMGRDEKRFLK